MSSSGRQSSDSSTMASSSSPASVKLMRPLPPQHNFTLHTIRKTQSTTPHPNPVEPPPQTSINKATVCPWSSCSVCQEEINISLDYLLIRTREYGLFEMKHERNGEQGEDKYQMFFMDWSDIVDHNASELINRRCKGEEQQRIKLSKLSTGSTWSAQIRWRTKIFVQIQQEMEIKLERPISIGEVFIKTHIRAGGTYMHSKAKQICKTYQKNL